MIPDNKQPEQKQIVVTVEIPGEGRTDIKRFECAGVYMALLHNDTGISPFEVGVPLPFKCFMKDIMAAEIAGAIIGAVKQENQQKGGNLRNEAD